MTRDEAVQQVQLILGFRQDKTSEIQAQLRFQQNELEKAPTLPYFLKTEITNLVCNSGDPNLTVPTGFIREWEEDKLQVQDSGGTWRTLSKDSPDYLRSVYQAANGLPEAYGYIGGTYYTLFPTPDANYTFRQTYFKAEPVLSSNIENKWLLYVPFLLIGRAGLVLATGLRDQHSIGLFTAMIQAETDKLNALSTDRDGAGRRYKLGGED